MKTFADLDQGIPRLVVMFKQEGKNELFQWGMVGEAPLLSVIGHIVRVQAELPLLEPGDPRYNCPESALVIAWDQESRRFSWFVHPDIPTDPLIGMLENVKTLLLTAQTARRAASEHLILGPDGRPVRNVK